MAVPSSIQQQQQQPNWLDLPPKALELIIQKIAVSVGDMIRFEAVCCLWCKAAHSYLSSSSYDSPAPWLMLPTNPSDSAGSCNFFSPEDKKIYKINNMFRNHPPLAVLGSSRGWLVLYDDTFNNPCLFNPCSRLKILLPPLDVHLDIIPCRLSISKAILLSDPSTTKNWRVVVSFINGLAIYIHNITSTWTQFGCLKNYKDMLWHNDKLYALSLSHRGSVEVWDFENYNSSPTKVASLFSTLKNTHHLPRSTNIIKKLYYLVESLEDVLLVIQAIAELPNHKHQLHFYVYKLDYSGEKWEKLESLGDRILFLNGDRTSISISARNCLELQGNSIYFISSPEVQVESMALNAEVYNLEEKVAKPFPQPIDLPFSRPIHDLYVSNANTCWIAPNPIKPSHKEFTPIPTPKGLFFRYFLYSAALAIMLRTFRSRDHNSSN